MQPQQQHKPVATAAAKPGAMRWGAVAPSTAPAVPQTWDEMQRAGVLMDDRGNRAVQLADVSSAPAFRSTVDSRVNTAALPRYTPYRPDPARDAELEAIEQLLDPSRGQQEFAATVRPAARPPALPQQPARPAAQQPALRTHQSPRIKVDVTAPNVGGMRKI